ncbi:MAG: ABC transporter ATP-binding protein [Rhodospirillales bacterium]|nr:ABC transporter ATP-binding protein [Rhodospirillales bacterium]
MIAVQGLRVDYPEGAALDGVDLAIGAGERFGVAGESGSGKSTLARALLGLIAPPGRTMAKRLLIADQDALALSPRGWRALRGGTIGLVLQDARQALHPTRTVGGLLVEALGAHGPLGRSQARARALDLLAHVRLPDPRRVFDARAHELSGGMAQRAMMALALAARPVILIADEPTAALDPTIARQVMDELDRLVRDEGLTMLLISHDLPLLADHCDRVAVMERGRIVDTQPTGALAGARHPATRRLWDAVLRL